MILRFSRPWTLRRHQRDDALAIGSEIEVHGESEVRKLFPEPYPRLARHKDLSLHRVIRHHDPVVHCPIEELMSIPGPHPHHSPGIGYQHLSASVRESPHVDIKVPGFS